MAGVAFGMTVVGLLAVLAVSILQVILGFYLQAAIMFAALIAFAIFISWAARFTGGEERT